jgi:hypothetical protein
LLIHDLIAAAAVARVALVSPMQLLFLEAH